MKLKAQIALEKDNKSLLDSHSTMIQQNADAIVLKANTTNLVALENRVTSAESSITINANQIALKANASSLDLLTGRVTNAESSIIQNATDITQRVSSTDYNGNEIASRINQTATTISIEASKININGVVSANTYFKINANGSMEAKAGKIADWNITTDRIYAGTSSDYVGMSPGILSSSEYYAFWAGNSTPASAPFGVTRSGKLYATSGEVGAFTLASDRLFAGSSSTYVGIAPNVSGYSFWAGNPNPASAPFSVTRSGAVKMTTATLNGVDLTTGGIGNSYGHVFFTSSQGQLKLASGIVVATGFDWRLYGTDFTSASTSNTLGTSAYRWGGVWTTGGYVTASDQRLKDNIKPIENGVEFILNAKPVEYTMVDGQRKHFGFIAQEVQEIMTQTVGDFGGFIDPTIKPDWDTTDPTENDKPHYLSLRYEEFIAPMVQTIQHLEKRISALEENHGQQRQTHKRSSTRKRTVEN